ncbi:MAG: kinase [Lachnospiraceae bacterium]|nr:kinase [Lachnospiraceae bacterium]
MFGKGNKEPKKKPAKAKTQKVKKVKKEKKQKEVYVPIPGIMGLGEDYHIYHMTATDCLMGAAIGVAAGVAVGYVFFSSWVVAVILSAIVAIKIQKPYQEYLRKKRMKKLLLEFKDLLETLTASYSAGLTTAKAFMDAQKEMEDLFGEGADIVQELKMINVGLQHNYNIEELLLNFAQRSGLDDVDSFANVFEVCNRKGGNLKQIVGETRSVINDKIEIEMEIQTMVAASKNELNIMMVMPFIIMLTMRGMGDSMTGNSLVNVIVKFAALGMFLGAYALGNKLVEIKL